MKKTCIFCAVAALAFTACEQQENVPQEGQAIRFEAPVMAPVVKSNGMALQGTTYPEAGQFAVSAVWREEADFTTYGWNAGTAYFTEAVAEHATVPEDTHEAAGLGTWVTNPVNYWPKQGYLTFQAYHPASVKANATIGGTGVKFHGANESDNYVLALDGTQVDLLYSDRVADKVKDDCVGGTGLHGIQLTFKHALSSIRFVASAEGIDDNTIITVTGIELLGVKNQGIFNQGMSDTETVKAGTWTPAGDLVNYADVVTADQVIAHTAGGTLLTENVTAVNDLLVMPQNLTNDAKIKVSYTIQSGENAPLAQTAEVQINTLTVGTGEASTSLAAFEMGKQYTFTFTWKLDVIHFAPQVTDWVGVTVNPQAL